MTSFKGPFLKLLASRPVATGAVLVLSSLTAVACTTQVATTRLANAPEVEAASPALSPLFSASSLSASSFSACTPDEAALTQGGSYSTNVDLLASVALPGNSGVDVVMTPFGAIAAVNTDAGATLHWIDPTNGETRLAKDLSQPISDIAFDGRETLAIATNGKILTLSAASSDQIAEISLPDVKRVAISPEAHIAAIAGKTVHLYSNEQKVFSKRRDYTDVTDIELRACGSDRLVYVTSFQNANFTDLNNQRNPVQIARLEALSFTGDVQWSLFSDRPETIKQNVADTRLYRVTLGRDGYLYIGGESAGTATIFRWRGQPMSADEQYGRATPFLTRTDANTHLHNSGSAHLPYYARVHPTKGELVTSQMTFPRLSSTKANTMRIGDIAASENGSLYFGGMASGSIPNREALTLNGAPVGDYAKGDRAWLSVSPNFRDRNFWTVLADEGGKGIVQGVDAGYGYSAALSNAESGSVPVTTGENTSSVFLSFIAE